MQTTTLNRFSNLLGMTEVIANRLLHEGFVLQGERFVLEYESDCQREVDLVSERMRDFTGGLMDAGLVHPWVASGSETYRTHTADLTNCDMTINIRVVPHAVFVELLK